MTQAEGLNAVRCQGPAHPDLLVPVSGEDEAVIRTHGLCARVRKSRALVGRPEPAPPPPALQPLICIPFLVHTDAAAPTRVSLLPPTSPRSCMPGPPSLLFHMSSQSPSPGDLSFPSCS